jgi:hypothetical protein
VVEEFPLVKTQLLGVKPALHGEVDRLEKEALFRFAIVPPLAAICLWAALNDTALWALSLIPIVALLFQGWVLRQEAGDTLVTTLRAQQRRVEPPSLSKETDELRNALRASLATASEDERTREADARTS